MFFYLKNSISPVNGVIATEYSFFLKAEDCVKFCFSPFLLPVNICIIFWRDTKFLIMFCYVNFVEKMVGVRDCGYASQPQFLYKAILESFKKSLYSTFGLRTIGINHFHVQIDFHSTSK